VLFALFAAFKMFQRAFVGPAVSKICAEQARQQGIFLSIQKTFRHRVPIVLLRRDVFSAIVVGQVDTKPWFQPRERTVLGIAVPKDRRACRNFDRDNMLVAVIANEISFGFGRLAVMTMASWHHG